VADYDEIRHMAEVATDPEQDDGEAFARIMASGDLPLMGLAKLRDGIADMALAARSPESHVASPEHLRAYKREHARAAEALEELEGRAVELYARYRASLEGCRCRACRASAAGTN
jgi:hypothetical protein